MSNALDAAAHHRALVAALLRGEEKLAMEVAAERAGKRFGFSRGVELTTREAWEDLLPQAVLDEVAERRPQWKKKAT